MLTFQPYQITEDEFDDSIETRIWALTPHSAESPTKPCLIRVRNCVKIFYLEIPDTYFYYESEYLLERNEFTIQGLMRDLMSKFSDIVSINLCSKKKLNEYENDREYMMFRVSVKNLKFINFKKRILEEYGMECPSLRGGKIKYSVIEGNISVINRAMIDYNFNYTSWMRISTESTKNKISLIEEYLVDSFDEIEFPKEEETQGLHTSAKILSYDLETYSPKDGVFTVPEFPECVMYMCSFAMRERDGSVRKILLMIGPLKDKNDNDWCPEEYEIIYVPDEIDFIKKWIELIKELDPEVITGYNILKFDNNYINKRARMLGVYLEDPSRLKIKGELVFKEQSTETRAYGKQSIVYSEKIEGRIMLDMLPFIEKQYRLPQYKLDIVAKEFLGDKKDDVPAEKMFKAYRLQHGVDQTVDPPIIDHFPMREVASYCIKDSDLVIRLFEKLNLWNATIETSKVVDVGCQELYIRGQQIRCFNVLHKMAHANDYVMQNRKNAPDYFVQGAYVCPPTPALEHNVMVWDFASLYPSIIIANNICFSTLVLDDDVPDYMCNIIETVQIEPIDAVERKKDVFGKLDDNPNGDDSDSDDEIVKVETSSKKKNEKIEVKYRLRFLKKEHKEGVLPKIVSGLVTERRRVRTLMKGKSAVESAILDARQLALKVTGNSCYGFTGIRKNAKYPCLEIAIAVTGWGREYITKSMEVIINNFRCFESKVVYGDTDSTFAVFPKATRKDWPMIRKQVAEQVEALLPKPLEFEYEKTYAAMLIFKKKNYAGYLLDKEDNVIMSGGKEKLYSSGIEIVRRDKFKFMKNMQERLIRITLTGSSCSDLFCLRYIKDRILDLTQGNFDPEDLTAVKKMGSNYKSDSSFMKVFADKLRDLGKPVQASEQLKYIILESTEKNVPLGKKAILFEDFNETSEIDLEYYIRLLVQPIDKIFKVAYGEKYKDNFPFEAKNSNFKSVSASTPMSMIHKIILDAQKLEGWGIEFICNLMETFDKLI